MIEQLKTIRCIPLESCAKCPYSVGRQTCSKAQRDFEGGRPAVPPDWCPLPALHPPVAQLEAMVGEQEPVAEIIQSPGRNYVATKYHPSYAPRVGDKYYLAAPVAQQPQLKNFSMTKEWLAEKLADGDDETISAGRPCDGPPGCNASTCLGCGENKPVAQQPQARQDFTDEWTGYLKDGETPFERFLRERKDLQSVLKLYQRVLEENERLKGQQPQAEAVRSEQEIVDQTEELAAMLMSWAHGREAVGGVKLRNSKHPRAKSCWQMACRIQEFLTLTDPENAVAEVDGMEEAAPQQAEAVPSDVVCDKDPQGCWNVRCQLGKVCKNAAIAQQKGQP